MHLGYAPFGWGWLGVVLMFVWWIAVIVLAVMVIRWIAGTGGGARRPSAMEILRERFAKGEMTKREFEDRKKELE